MRAERASGECVDAGNARAVWGAVGVQTDRVSAPMLTWRLPLDRRTALGRLSTAANNAAVPLHMNAMALG